MVYSTNRFYIIKEAYILFESNTFEDLDAIICVSCPEDIRLNHFKEGYVN